MLSTAKIATKNRNNQIYFKIIFIFFESDTGIQITLFQYAGLLPLKLSIMVKYFGLFARFSWQNKEKI